MTEEREKEIKDSIKELFKHTSKERFMGGKLVHAQIFDEEYILIECEKRADSNMIHSIMNCLEYYYDEARLVAANSDMNTMIYHVTYWNGFSKWKE